MQKPRPRRVPLEEQSREELIALIGRLRNIIADKTATHIAHRDALETKIRNMVKAKRLANARADRITAAAKKAIEAYEEEARLFRH